MQTECSIAPTAKPVGDSVRATTRANMYENGFGSYQRNKVAERTTRSTLAETASADGRWVYVWIVNRTCANCLKLQRLLDRANGKHRQRQCRTIASEYICGLLIRSTLTAQRCRENIRSSQRQTLSETVSGDNKWAYVWKDIRKLPNWIKLQREYSFEPTANPVISESVGRWHVSIFVDC